ncbi:MAG: hypothetical protein RLN76_05155 [Phycisphaeraceae bacterium]
MFSIRCGRCGATMQFGEGACGRRAKCLKCENVFRLPTQKALMEDTVSDWILEDVDQVLTKRDEFYEERNRPDLDELSYDKVRKTPSSFDSTIQPAVQTRAEARETKAKAKAGAKAPVSEECRQRLETWSPMAPGERLRKYYPDADFGPEDEGYNGVLITNQRLIFRKGHNNGEVSLDEPDAVILARVRGHSASLNLMIGHDRTRMARIDLHHLKRLTREIHTMNRGIKLLIGDGQGNDA